MFRTIYANTENLNQEKANFILDTFYMIYRIPERFRRPREKGSTSPPASETCRKIGGPRKIQFFSFHLKLFTHEISYQHK